VEDITAALSEIMHLNFIYNDEESITIPEQGMVIKQKILKEVQSLGTLFMLHAIFGLVSYYHVDDLETKQHPKIPLGVINSCRVSCY
jgi:hypothetical protein